MSKIVQFFIVALLLNLYSTQKTELKKHRSLLPHPLYNTTSKQTSALKFHSKLLQTVYSDSFSKNYYYTTLYVGQDKVRQTYIIDTGSSIMSSPCSPCEQCGSHKRAYYYDQNRLHKPLKCGSKICNLVPATNCLSTKTLFSRSCSFKINRVSGDGITGYYLRDIVYFETDRKYHAAPFQRKVYRSYALPIGCTTGELGKYKELNTDGIMGMNNNPKSFSSLLYNLKIINSNIFTLCFGLRGGYMSLGEVDTTFHKSENIEYVPLLSSTSYYLIKVNSLKVGDSPNAIKNPVIAMVDTGNSISYFPSTIFKNLTKQFSQYCKKLDGKCGNFTYDNDLGYCAAFQDRETLFRAIYQNWPNITLTFGESEYKWRPINYYYYHFDVNIRKACLGFNFHSSDKIILGSNFIHGHDIIFDKNNNRLGFVPSDCSRGNLIWNRWQGILGNKAPQFETTDPVLIDKELHHGETENKFHLGDNNNNDMIDFVQGHNTELDGKEFRTLNFIILLISIIIIAIVLVVVLSVLLCGRKKLTYEQQQGEENNEEDNQQPQNEIREVNTSDNNITETEPNKITFEETAPQEINLEDNK